MNTIEPMLRLHPHADVRHAADFADVIHTLTACAETCNACADACLGEERADLEHLRRCIRLDQDCADICQTTARLLGRQTETSFDLVREQLHTCVLALQLCAEECDQHAEYHRHCRICEETCRDAQRHCNELLGELSDSGMIDEEDEMNPGESTYLR